jgi:hypothetical protein
LPRRSVTSKGSWRIRSARRVEGQPAAEAEIVVLHIY